LEGSVLKKFWMTLWTILNRFCLVFGQATRGDEEITGEAEKVSSVGKHSLS
jgi:hypothetical protein